MCNCAQTVEAYVCADVIYEKNKKIINNNNEESDVKRALNTHKNVRIASRSDGLVVDGKMSIMFLLWGLLYICLLFFWISQISRLERRRKPLDPILWIGQQLLATSLALDFELLVLGLGVDAPQVVGIPGAMYDIVGSSFMSSSLGPVVSCNPFSDFSKRLWWVVR